LRSVGGVKGARPDRGAGSPEVVGAEERCVERLLAELLAELLDEAALPQLVEAVEVAQQVAQLVLDVVLGGCGAHPPEGTVKRRRTRSSCGSGVDMKGSVVWVRT